MISTRDARLRTGVYFYQPNYDHQVTQRRDLDDLQDFRWLIDFESDYLYRKFFSVGQQFLPHNSGVYNPIVSVPYGIFYTLHQTASTFILQTKDGKYVSDLGPVADIIAANIYVKPNATIEININNSPQPIAVQAPAEIYFLNPCLGDPTNNYHCESEPYNLDHKELRGDFFLNYRAFQHGSAPEYELFIAENLKYDDTNLGLNCLRVRREQHTTDKHKRIFRDGQIIFVSDEAPCSGTGYGGGYGIPPG